jgi:hypothetical protein
MVGPRPARDDLDWLWFGERPYGKGTQQAVLRCKHLGIDPFTYLRKTLPGLFALGENPSAEPLLEWAATPDARRLVGALPEGAPEAHLTQQAKAIRERLARRPTDAA